MVVMMAVVMMRGLGRNGRDGKDGDSGKGKQQVAKFHGDGLLSQPDEHS